MEKTSSKRFKDKDKVNLVQFVYASFVLGSNQFLLLPQQPKKVMLP